MTVEDRKDDACLILSIVVHKCLKVKFLYIIPKEKS